MSGTTAQAVAPLPEPPYYAVIFTSMRTSAGEGYDAMSARMVELAQGQPGFLGVESVRAGDGAGITVSYWRDLESIAAWRAHAQHRVAQETGRSRWYERYAVRIARVERAYGYASASPGASAGATQP
jgi:heme-degrading monooxygenase HmoA